MTAAATSPRVLVVGYANATQHVVSAMYGCGVPPVALLTLTDERLQQFSDRGDFGPLVRQQGLKLIPIRHVNDAASLEVLRQLGADVLFVMGWSQIVSRAVLDMFPRGAFGLHPSYLPSNKGRAPIPWTILKGERQSAVSFFRLAETVDSGDVHVQVVFDVAPRETATTLYAKVARAIGEGVPRLLEQVAARRFEVVESGRPETYNYARRPEDGFIDWNRTAVEIDRLVRASTRPYPGAFTARRQGKDGSWEKVIVWESDLVLPGAGERAFCASPGQVIGRAREGGVLVYTGDGVLELKEIEAGAGGPVPARDYRLAAGERFGFTAADLFFGRG